MNRDIITGMDGEIYARLDLSREWGGALDLGTARTGKSFEVDGHLGETNRCGVWDSVDRLRFRTSRNLRLELATDPNVITELVRFDSKGVVTVVGSVEYGGSEALALPVRLSLNLTPGRYGLSFFVEGDLISYQVNASFI
ncbi:hypothetical protein PN472_11980 [Microcystis aeruginosa CS-1036]|uniref:hypothetical protein n=1 Tax=Microcystis TaxID=1125 RepID=UPI00232EDABC|nr:MULTISPECIES: hypothetical protein [Microcystis]MDB9405460.1 hypothetical protein [Microcystis sp. CS-574]MDB9543854.1 hypothetical protein [Microcystis aeruginosa CS-1036]